MRAFFQISSRYWARHKRRVVTLAAVCILGAAALSFSCLYVKSAKAVTLEKQLDRLGDYDGIIYNIGEGDLAKVGEQEDILDYGYYRQLGYAGTERSEQFMAASFPDGGSEEMYHMTCTKGNYPRGENEIAIDLEAAKKLGIPPSIGQEAELVLYDAERNAIARKEVAISGIFEASAGSGSLNGYYRETTGTMEQGYSVPAIFFSDGARGDFKEAGVTAFYQTDADAADVAARIREMEFPEGFFSEATQGRFFAYQNITGIGSYVARQFEEQSVSGILADAKSGNVAADFYTSVLIPLFSMLILVIVALSVYSITRDIIVARSDQIAILRSIGMTRSGSFIYLLAELSAFVAAFILIGMALGAGTHCALVAAMNRLFEMRMPVGLSVHPVVDSVTPGPFAYAAAVVAASSAIAVLPNLIRMARCEPIQLFLMRPARARGRERKRRQDSSRWTWRGVVGSHVKFNEKAVAVILCIIMSASFFGYNYMRSYVSSKVGSYDLALAASGLEGYDFRAEKLASHGSRSYFLIEGLHDDGISMEDFEQIAGDEAYADSFARIVKKSTRLSYKKDGEDAARYYLKPFAIRDFSGFENSVNEFEHAEYEGERVALEEMGYPAGEAEFAMPMVGILPGEWENLSQCVVEGAIDLEKIAGGEEVVLAVPFDQKDAALEAFHAGDSLPLSDVMLSGEEEAYQFATGEEFGKKDPLYEREVESPWGAVVTYKTWAYGERRDVDVKVGAIAVLGDSDQYGKYLVPGSELASGANPGADAPPDYAPCLLCSPETFESLGLPDRKLTDIRLSASEDASLTEANDRFYELLGSNQGISYSSSYEIRQENWKDTAEQMTIFYILIVTLILLGMATVAIRFYSRMKFQSRTLAKLRAVGMSLPQIESLILRQNAAYPLVGAAISVVPVALFQALFDYINRQIESGAWNSAYSMINGESQDYHWYLSLPFSYSLLDYHPGLVLLGNVLIFEALMLLATLPQIIYLKKQSIADEIDRDSF